MPDLSKLPKWARERIEYAERDLVDLREEVYKRVNNERTRVAIVDWYRREDVMEHFINEHQTVRFYFGDIEQSRDCIDAKILVRNGELVLEIGGEMNAIAVTPVASNMIHVVLKAR